MALRRLCYSAPPRPVAGMRAKVRAWATAGQVFDVPTEICELLVDALESHGCCVYVWVGCGW